MATSQNSPEWIHSVVDVYEQPLLSYALRILGDLDRARDAVQETFLRLCTEDRARIDGHLAEWLFAVCRSRAVDMQRKEKRMSSYSEIETRMAAQAAPPSDPIEQSDTASHVLKHLSQLPENQQEVIRLKFQHGLSYREISRVTHLSVTNVGFLIHAGLKTLRQRLAPVGQ